MCIIAAIFVIAIVCLLILIRVQDSLNLYKCTKPIERDPWTRDINVQVTYTGRPEDRKIEQTEQNVIDDLQKQYDEAREKDQTTTLPSASSFVPKQIRMWHDTLPSQKTTRCSLLNTSFTCQTRKT